MSETLTAIAFKCFSNLTATESAFLSCAEEGIAAEPATHLDVSLRASLLGWLCTETEAKRRVHRRGLLLDSFTIVGLLDLIFSDVSFQLDFIGCTFTDAIWLKGAHLSGLKFRACVLHGVFADSVQISDNLLFINGCESIGEISARGATIGGDLRADGSVFRATDTQAMMFDRSRIDGEVRLSRNEAPSEFVGGVTFSGAEVGANLDCVGGTFKNENGFAFRAERISTKGNILLENCAIEGQVLLGHSQIGGMLDCRNAKMKSNCKRTLDAEKASIQTNVLLDLGFVCDKVHFIAANIEGSIRCRSSEIGLLDLRYTQILDMLELLDLVEPKNLELDLRDAKIGAMRDEAKSWPMQGKLHLNGLRYERFSGDKVSLSERIDWLKRDSSKEVQPYRQLGTVFEQNGQPGSARRVLYEMECQIHTRESGWLRRRWNNLLNVTIGYGYRLSRAALIMTALTAIGFVLAISGYKWKLITPTDRDANAYFVDRGMSPQHYQRFSPLAFTLENSLPALNLGVSANWSANTSSQSSEHPFTMWFVRDWFWVQRTAGWVLSIFVIAGISGVIKSVK